MSVLSESDGLKIAISAVISVLFSVWSIAELLTPVKQDWKFLIYYLYFSVSNVIVQSETVKVTLVVLIQSNSKLQILFSFKRRYCEDAMNNAQFQSNVHNLDHDLHNWSRSYTHMSIENPYMTCYLMAIIISPYLSSLPRYSLCKCAWPWPLEFFMVKCKYAKRKTIRC